MNNNTSTPKKLINRYDRGLIELEVQANSREQAWTELTNVGATVTYCARMPISDITVAVGNLDGNLIEIEQLERKGWTWYRYGNR